MAQGHAAIIEAVADGKVVNDTIAALDYLMNFVCPGVRRCAKLAAQQLGRRRKATADFELNLVSAIEGL